MNQSKQHNPYFGVIGDEWSEQDYQLGSEIELQRAPRKYQDSKIQYNQDDVSPVSCTIHGALGAFSDLTGYVFPQEERNALWGEALKLGADPNVGWYTRSAVDLVRRHVNESQNAKYKTLLVTVGSDDFFRALRLGYSVVVSHRGNSAYTKDKDMDGILDGLEFGATTYGHCLRMTYSVGDGYELVVNNYVGKHKHNTYKVPSDHLNRLIANRVFFATGYIFTHEYQNTNPNIPIWAASSWKKAIKKGLIASDSYPFEDMVIAGMMEDMLIKLGIFTEQEKKITLVRWVVALDRMGQLD